MAYVKLKMDVFNELTKALTDIKLSKMMSISRTQLWRVRLPDSDPRHNDPGIDFVVGALIAFPHKTFEDLFSLNEPLRGCNTLLACNDIKIANST